MSKRILVIDDDPTLLQVTRSTLERMGYEVHTHDSPFGTTTLVRRLNPDLILLDVNMPGLSGDQLLELMRQGDLDIHRAPVVFYSSNDESQLNELATRHGVRGYVCKGDMAQLRSRVARYVQGA